jgi:hypothetical protein
MLSSFFLSGGSLKVKRFVMPLEYSLVGAFLVMGCWPSGALAQDHDAHTMTSQHQAQTAEQKKQGNALVNIVRDATARFRDVSVAVNDGYGLLFGCVSGGDYGAMGLHFVNFPLVADGKIDAATPEIVLYEPASNGRLRLTGADFVVFAADWDKTHTSAPELNGQLFHFFEAPNRFGLPPFYTLHVWAWKDNPNGTFTNWNPTVSCDGFNGQNP